MSQSCPDSERLSAFIDAELPQHERRVLQRHLMSCPTCRDLLETMQAQATVLRHLAQTKVPFDLAPAIQARIEARPARTARPRRRNWLELLPLGGGAVAAAALGLTMGMGLSVSASLVNPVRTMEVFSSTAPGNLCPVERICQSGRLAAIRP